MKKKGSRKCVSKPAAVRGLSTRRRKRKRTCCQLGSRKQRKKPQSVRARPGTTSLVDGKMLNKILEKFFNILPGHRGQLLLVGACFFLFIFAINFKLGQRGLLLILFTINIVKVRLKLSLEIEEKVSMLVKTGNTAQNMEQKLMAQAIKVISDQTWTKVRL